MESKGERIIGRKVEAEEFMVAFLGDNLHRQFDSIRESRTAWGAMAAAGRYEEVIGNLAGHLAESFGLAAGRPRAELLREVAEAAEERGFDARAIRAALPDLFAIHDRIETQKAASPYAAARIARRHLLGGR